MSIQCKIDKKENTITFGLSIVDVLSDEGKKELEWMTSHWKALTDMVHRKMRGELVEPAEFTCPVCGCHEFEVVRRLGEVVLSPTAVTINKNGNINAMVEDDIEPFEKAEVLEEYWRCAECSEAVDEEDFTPIL